MPARSVTLNTILLLPVNNVTPVQLIAVPLAIDVISIQVVPPSNDPYRLSPVDKAPDSVALIVCAAVCVIKSLPLNPVSALRLTPLTVSVGELISMVVVSIIAVKSADAAEALPARSITLAAIP